MAETSSPSPGRTRSRRRPSGRFLVCGITSAYDRYLFPKASLIYRRTKNLRAVQLLLGHASMERTIRYLGIEVDDALELAEQTEA